MRENRFIVSIFGPFAAPKGRRRAISVLISNYERTLVYDIYFSVGIVSKSQNVIVDSLPEHSDSDIAGSISSEDLFNSEKKYFPWNWEEWIDFCIGSPFILGIIIGLAVALLLLIIGFCLVFNICRY